MNAPAAFPVYDGAYTYVQDPEPIPEIARQCLQTGVIGLDIETMGHKGGGALHPWDGEIRLIQIHTGKAIYVVDLMYVPRDADGPIAPLLEVLASEKVIKIIQNARFEQKWFLDKYNVEMWPLFDTERASRILYNGWNNLSHKLGDLYQRELEKLGHRPTKEALGDSDWSQPVLSRKQLDYAAEDVGWLHQLRGILRQKLIDHGLVKCGIIEFGAVLPEAAIELTGFYLNRFKWLELYEHNLKEREKARLNLLKEMPHPKGQLALPTMVPSWNINSTQQIAASLRRMGVKVYGPDKKLHLIGDELLVVDRNDNEETVKLNSTKEMVLAQVADKYPVIDTILTYRGFEQRCKTFGPSYLEYINPKSGRIHTNFFPFTGAGRYSCSSPQLHNIPRDAEFRACFEAERGNKLVSADYAGIEMRIVAEISGDETLLRVFIENKDAHRYTAAIVQDKSEDLVSKEERQQAKPVNFGLIYGMQADKLKEYAKAEYGVTMSLNEARKFRTRYFDAYAGIAAWHERQLRHGVRRGEARTLSGRRRFLGDQAHNEFLNTPVQGTGADALKMSLRNVYFRLKKYGDDVKGIVHHVHDEITAECIDNDELVHCVEQEINEGMTESMQEFLHRCPVLVEPANGRTWADVH